jgi:hypothetical protein
VAFVEHLSGFFTDFAVVALYNGATPVSGIFDAAYEEPLGNDVEGYGPTFQCAAADVAGVTQGKTLVINAGTYKVRGVKPDGTGLMLLKLEAQ